MSKKIQGIAVMVRYLIQIFGAAQGLFHSVQT